MKACLLLLVSTTVVLALDATDDELTEVAVALCEDKPALCEAIYNRTTVLTISKQAVFSAVYKAQDTAAAAADKRAAFVRLGKRAPFVRLGRSEYGYEKRAPFVRLGKRAYEV